MTTRPCNLATRVRMLAVGAICAGTLAAAPASAGVLCFASNVNPETFCDMAYHVRHTITCVNPAATYQRVALFFNGECSVGAVNTVDWLDVDILVNGVPIPPSSDDNAFCTSTGDNGTNAHWSSNSTQGVASLAPGNNTITVRERLTSPGCFRLDDTSLMVLD